MSNNNFPLVEIRFSPEIDLVIACSRVKLDPCIEERIINLINSEINWDLVLEIAVYHGVLPFLHLNLSKINSTKVPNIFKEELNTKVRTHTTRNLITIKILNELVSACESAGIQMYTYKGVILSLSVYENIFLRQFSDIDLCVPKEQLSDMSHQLYSLKFFQVPVLTSRQKQACLRLGGESMFVNENNKIVFDLHWALFPGESHLKNFENQVWSRLEYVKIGKTFVKSPSLVDLMLILCLHGSKPGHCWARLKWICDIAELSSKFSLQDWTGLFERAQEFGVEHFVYLGLYLTHDLLSVSLPDSFFYPNNKFMRVEILAEQISKRMFMTKESERGFFDNILFYLRVRSAVNESFSITFHRLITPTNNDWNQISLPVWMYYFYRPFRLLKKYL